MSKQNNNEKGWLEDERLVQAQKLAALGELSAGLAHEINNPLAMIRQEAELLLQLASSAELERQVNMEEFRDSLEEIVHQVDRCKSITHNLLNYARKNEPVIQNVDVNRVMDDMLRLVEKEAMQHNISIVRNYCQDLPPVSTDAPQLRQVVLNLLNNAVQAIAREGEILVGTDRLGPGHIQIRIQDNGMGIAPEHLNKLFDPFFTTKSPGQGTGLGLSISQKIVSRLGGTIRVHSEPEHGSTFSVVLPLTSTKQG